MSSGTPSESLIDARDAFVSDPDFVLYVGDVRDRLKRFPDASVDCVATSPPFYGLRDYGTGTWDGGDPDCDHTVREEIKVASSTLEGSKATSGHSREGYKGVCARCGAARIDRQIGLEDTPEAWVDVLVEVFAECRRVLRPTGTLWIECGDSYVSGQGGRQSAVGELPPSTRFDRKEAGQKREGLPSSFGERDVGPRFYPGRDTGLKPKDLLGQPWMLAFGLRADGWWLRQSIIWHKPNAMPESATDRCTTNHSYVFLLSKQARYHFDAEAIAEPLLHPGDARRPMKPLGWATEGSHDVLNHSRTLNEHGGRSPNRNGFRGEHDGPSAYVGQQGPQSNSLANPGNRRGNGQKARTEERRGFDNRLERADGKKNARSVWTIPAQGYADAHFATWPEALVERIIKAGCPEGGIVLDPFMGSGTTALVARRLGRKAVGIELNPEYAELCARRLAQQSLLAEPAA